MTIVENINVRKKAIDLSKDIYIFCRENNYIKNDFSLRDQLQRSSISIASNIAEGADRETQKEFGRFLYIARGSCSELKTQLTIIKTLDYIKEAEFNELIEKIIQIHKMLNGMIKKVATNH